MKISNLSKDQTPQHHASIASDRKPSLNPTQQANVRVVMPSSRDLCRDFAGLDSCHRIRQHRESWPALLGILGLGPFIMLRFLRARNLSTSTIKFVWLEIEDSHGAFEAVLGIFGTRQMLHHVHGTSGLDCQLFDVKVALRGLHVAVDGWSVWQSQVRHGPFRREI